MPKYWIHMQNHLSSPLVQPNSVFWNEFTKSKITGAFYQSSWSTKVQISYGYNGAIKWSNEKYLLLMLPYSNSFDFGSERHLHRFLRAISSRKSPTSRSVVVLRPDWRYRFMYAAWNLKIQAVMTAAHIHLLAHAYETHFVFDSDISIFSGYCRVRRCVEN